MRFADSTGHWLDAIIDGASLGYDVYTIRNEGWTWVNAGALIADIACIILPIVTGGGVLVRTLAHAVDATADIIRTAEEVADVTRTTNNTADSLRAAEEASDEVTDFYRSMQEGEDGLPVVQDSARGLGARDGDISSDSFGKINPGTGGMSVSPNTPMNLPDFRRPAEFGGSGPDPVWCIRSCDIGPDLTYRPDPARPTTHGFFEPVNPMSASDYRQALAQTRNFWTLVLN